MTTNRDNQAREIAIAEMARAGLLKTSYKDKPIQYIDPAPKPFKVQIPLVEYFERITRLKADKWQIHFCNYLQNAVENRHVKPTFAEFHAQAQLGKTRVLSQVFPAWCFGHDPMFRYVLAMYNISRSESHSDVIIQIMRSSMHLDIFTNKDGHLPASVSKAGWMTNARRDVASGQMDAQKSLNPVGLESGMTGSGFDWLTIDDPYKEPRDAWSLTTYDNLARFWEYGVVPRLAAHACIAAMFHRYTYDDFGGYLLNTGKFDYVRYAAIADGAYEHLETGQRFEDPLGRADGELICPERFGLNYYADKQDEPKMWLSMFQGRPGRDEGDFFKVGMIGTATVDDWLRCSSRARGWDHAATQGGGDNSAGSLGGFQADGTFIFNDVFSAQLDSANRVAKQKEIAEADGPAVTVVVPEGVSADGKDNVFMMRQNLRDFNVVARKVTNAAPGSDAKKRRAYNLSIAVNSGKVKFLPGPWADRVKMLMRRFGNAISGDDEIDAMADTYNHLYEEFHKGLVIKDFSNANLEPWVQFIDKFGPKVPAHWTTYAALKITPDASMPNSAVIVTRAAQNSGLSDSLFVVGEYKEYTSDYLPLFKWIDDTLKARCLGEKNAMVWLHPDSAEYRGTLLEKYHRTVVPFTGGEGDGLAELNWYISNGKLKGLMANADDLYAFRQEALTWGHNDKGEPTKVAAVLDCLRIITHRFRTMATELTPNERVEEAMPTEYRIANMLKSTGRKHLTDSQQLARSLMEQEIRDNLKIERQTPDWLDEGANDLLEFEREGGY